MSAHPVKSKRPHSSSLAEFFWSRVNKDGANGCWLWEGQKRDGYGIIRRGRRRLAHRYAYELTWGIIPDDCSLDHLCMNTLCVNPWHLEPVSRRENAHRNRQRGAVGRYRNPHNHSWPSTEIIYWPILKRWVPI